MCTLVIICVLFACVYRIILKICGCSLVFPIAQIVSANYCPVNVLFTQVSALLSLGVF